MRMRQSDKKMLALEYEFSLSVVSRQQRIAITTENCNQVTDLDRSFKNRHHFLPSTELQVWEFVFFPQSKWQWFVRCISEHDDKHTWKVARWTSTHVCKDHEHILFAFVSECVVGKDPHTSIGAPWMRTPLQMVAGNKEAREGTARFLLRHRSERSHFNIFEHWVRCYARVVHCVLSASCVVSMQRHI